MKACCREYLDGQFGGDGSLVAEVYDEYVKSAREKADEAAVALADGRYADLDQIAHAAKGNALAVGDSEAVEAAIALRAAARDGDRDAAAALVSRMKDLSAAL